MSTITELKKSLRAARALLNLNQSEVAKKAGVSRSVIMRMETEGGTVHSSALDKVVAAFAQHGIEIEIGAEYGSLRWRIDK